MNDPLSAATCNTETLLKHQTRQAILDASDQVSIGLHSRVLQLGSKKRRFTDSPMEEMNTTDFSKGESSTINLDTECAKRVCLSNDEESKQTDGCLWKQEQVDYWVALDLVTAGRQGLDIGRDQTPIVQLILALGQFKSKTVGAFLTTWHTCAWCFHPFLWNNGDHHSDWFGSVRFLVTLEFTEYA